LRSKLAQVYRELSSHGVSSGPLVDLQQLGDKLTLAKTEEERKRAISNLAKFVERAKTHPEMVRFLGPLEEILRSQITKV